MVDGATRQHEHSERAEEVKRPSQAPVELTGGLTGDSAVFDSLLAAPAMNLPVERQAATLNDARFNHPANASQKARMVGHLQRHYGNGHVQRVLDSMAIQPAPGVDSQAGAHAPHSLTQGHA
ncbi:MAG: hypothetical protein ACOC58_04990, partial [Chloroflexota bacterium]